MNDQQPGVGYHWDMNDFIFGRIRVKKENQISAPFKKWIREELIFHFFHFLFHLFPHFLKRGKNHLPIEVREICSFSRD